MLKEEKINRRVFINKLMKIIAGAAGVSLIDIKKLLSEDIKPIQKNQEYNIFQKSVSREIKCLKVLIENNIRVFENEFGRTTPVIQKPIEKVIPVTQIPSDLVGSMANVCGINFSPIDTSDWFNSFICSSVNNMDEGGMGTGSRCEGTNNCTGGQACILDTCPTNNCDGQSCKQGSCGTNTCDDQDCTKFSKCDKNTQKIVTAMILERYISDPYVQHLMTRFNISSAKQLELQIHNLFLQRRQTLMRQRPDLMRKKQEFINQW